MKKILIIEDEPSYMMLLNDQLRKNGYEVSVARDGQEGLIIATQEKPGLILLDIKMPVMNGLTMLEELRKDEYGKSAKVIILTNLEPDDQIIQKVIKGLPTYYLIKSDILLSDLMEKIKDIFKEDNRASESNLKVRREL